MDLLATVRKEGSRGGTGDFKWSDVQSSSRREHYLGHSLMAPVGRWQKNRDLNWYAKSDSNTADIEDEEARAARERKEELRRVKEAEEDAMARALGLPVPDRTNPNLQALGDTKEVDQVLRTIDKDGLDGSERGVGFGKNQVDRAASGVITERIEGNAEAEDKELRYALKEYKRRHTDDRRDRKRSRSRERNRRSRKRDRSEEQYRHRHSSRDVHRHRRRREHSRSRSASRSRHDENDRRRRRDRSRSPVRNDDHRPKSRRHER